MISHDKQALRAEFRERRLSLDSHTRLTATLEILWRLQEIISDSAARSICLYWPLVERGEIELRPLIRELWKTGFEVSLPVIVQDDPPRMEAVRVNSEDALEAGRWGLMEPHGEVVEADKVDLIVVPALAADHSRNRLGYGKGFYDAFLARTNATTVCAVFDVSFIERLPVEPHDKPVDIVVTESVKLAG